MISDKTINGQCVFSGAGIWDGSPIRSARQIGEPSPIPDRRTVPNSKELIQKDLRQAGRDTRRQEILDMLLPCLITDKTVIPPMRFLFRLFGKVCFPKKELVAITGKAKSGKTFVSSLLMALGYREDVMGVQRVDTGEEGEMSPLRVLWFDTEQSAESTQDILVNRIMPMIGGGLEKGAGDVAGRVSTGGANEDLFEYFKIFNVRLVSWVHRLPMLEVAVEEYDPDLVILDGIRDVVDDINDGVLAQEVLERLTSLASNNDCCIVSIIHQNKSVEDKTLRGWLGTELMNKAFEVYECEKDENRIFTWSQKSTRKQDIVEKLKFSVGEDGIPRLCNVEQMFRSAQTGGAAGRPQLSPKYFIGRDKNYPVLRIPELFCDAFLPGEVKGANDLKVRVMELANITKESYYESCLKKALAQGVVVPSYDARGMVVYSCPSKPAEFQFPEGGGGTTSAPY